jgi:hypothetical protein
MANAEDADMEEETHFFDGKDGLQRWLREDYHMRDDEVQGWIDLLTVLGGGDILVLPRHDLFRDIASALRLADWSISRDEYIADINARKKHVDTVSELLVRHPS